MAQSAESLKEEGNKLFKEGKYKEAAGKALYAYAIADTQYDS
jgi:hypothetical protein